MTQNTHFFASCAISWGTAETQEKAIKSMIANMGSATAKQAIAYNKSQGRPGFEAVVYEVDLPNSATYDVLDYAPYYLTEKQVDGSYRRQLDAAGKPILTPIKASAGVYITALTGRAEERS